MEKNESAEYSLKLLYETEGLLKTLSRSEFIGSPSFLVQPVLNSIYTR